MATSFATGADSQDTLPGNALGRQTRHVHHREPGSGHMWSNGLNCEKGSGKVPRGSGEVRQHRV